MVGSHLDSVSGCRDQRQRHRRGSSRRRCARVPRNSADQARAVRLVGRRGARPVGSTKYVQGLTYTQRAQIDSDPPSTSSARRTRATSSTTVTTRTGPGPVSGQAGRPTWSRCWSTTSAAIGASTPGHRLRRPQRLWAVYPVRHPGRRDVFHARRAGRRRNTSSSWRQRQRHRLRPLLPLVVRRPGQHDKHRPGPQLRRDCARGLDRGAGR